MMMEKDAGERVIQFCILIGAVCLVGCEKRTMVSNQFQIMILFCSAMAEVRCRGDRAESGRFLSLVLKPSSIYLLDPTR